MNFRILGAILKKDALGLAPIVTVVALLFLADALITRLDLLPVWSMYKTPVVLAALVVLLLSVFQTDSPASLNDDWLCRPVPKGALIAAKLLLVMACVYLPRAVGTFAADLWLGFPLSESLLDAVLPQDDLILFLLPILLFTAIVTRTLVQGFGVLFGMLLCVFVLPTPFVRPPDPLTTGLREELLISGMQWMATTPAILVSMALVASGFWLVYWRRRVAPARLLMALTVCVTLLFMLLPMALAPWSTTFSIQTAFGPAPFVAPHARMLSRHAPQHAGKQPRIRVGGRIAARRRVEFHRLCHQHRSAGLAARWAGEAQLCAGELLRRRRDSLLAAPRPIHHRRARQWSAVACLDAAGRCRANAAGRAATTRARVFAVAAEATRVPRPHGRKAARVARPRVLQRRGR
jgi:hypothetical protein